MSCGNPPPARILDRDAAAGGLLALLSTPNGVDDAVIVVVAGVSEPERKFGRRKLFEASSDCSLEESSAREEDSGDSTNEAGFSAKSVESSGALGGVFD
jgi:hypothetical protein